jgi:hypothetical protein
VQLRTKSGHQEGNGRIQTVLKRMTSSIASLASRRVSGSAAPSEWSGRLASAHRAAGFLLALALIVLILFMMRLEWRRVLDEAQATTSTVAQILADNSDLLLESADLVRVQVSEIVGAEDPPAGDFDTFQQLRNLVEASAHLVSVWVGDEQGRAVLTSRQYPTPDLSAADRDYFRAVKDEPDRLFVGPLANNRFANEILISTSRRLSHADGSFRGFVQIALDPEHIRNTFQQVRLPFPASLWWIGPDDVSLLREPAVSEEVLTTEGRKFAQYAGVSSGSSFHGLGIDGSPKTFTAATSLRYGSRIIVGVADGDLRALWWKRVYPTMAFGFLLVFVPFDDLRLQPQGGRSRPQVRSAARTGSAGTHRRPRRRRSAEGPRPSGDAPPCRQRVRDHPGLGAADAEIGERSRVFRAGLSRPSCGSGRDAGSDHGVRPARRRVAP